MKRTYVRPTMVGERFVANEYVAACGDTEYGKYKFICDAGGGKKRDVYEETNGQDGLQRDDKCLTPGVLRYYHSCNVTHYADTNDEFWRDIMFLLADQHRRLSFGLIMEGMCIVQQT